MDPGGGGVKGIYCERIPPFGSPTSQKRFWQQKETRLWRTFFPLGFVSFPDQNGWRIVLANKNQPRNPSHPKITCEWIPGWAKLVHQRISTKHRQTDVLKSLVLAFQPPVLPGNPPQYLFKISLLDIWIRGIGHGPDWALCLVDRYPHGETVCRKTRPRNRSGQAGTIGTFPQLRIPTRYTPKGRHRPIRRRFLPNEF